MPAWITPLLCVLVSIPARGWRSSRQTECPRAPSSAAVASPVTPAPITATSTSVTWRMIAAGGLLLFDHEARDRRRQEAVVRRAPGEQREVVGAGRQPGDDDPEAAVEELRAVDAGDIRPGAAVGRDAHEDRRAARARRVHGIRPDMNRVDARPHRCVEI